MDQQECEPAKATIAPAPQQRRRRWLRRLLALSLAVAIVVLLREPFLRALAGFMIVEEPLRLTQYVLLLEEYCAPDEIARLYHEGFAAEVLLLERPPKRIEQLGIVPSSTALSQRELLARGVPKERLTILDCRQDGGWDDLRRLQAWLEKRPAVELTAVVRRFDARNWHDRLHAVLPPPVWKRIHLHTFARHGYDETNWWRSKPGVMDLFHAYVSYAYTLGQGEDTEPGRVFDPDAYRQMLQDR